MRISAALMIFCLAGNASGQTLTTKAGSAMFDPQAEYRPLMQEDGKTLESARGIWRTRGYGYLSDVTESNVQLYHETKAGIWKPDDQPSDLFIKLSKSGDTALITEHPLVPPFVVQRIKEMPADVSSDIEWTPTRIYDVFAATMSEHYVFFDERSFDWKARVDKYRSLVTDDMTETQLFDVMLKTLDGLDDSHVQLMATIDGEARQAHLGEAETMKLAKAAFDAQQEVTDFDDYLEQRLGVIQSGIVEKILGGNVNQSCNHLIWGTTANNVGYLFIPGMSGFADTEDPAEEIAALHDGLDAILTELADTRSLIVDVSTNGGGSDFYSRAIASHFVDQRRLAFTKGPRHVPEIKHTIYIEPYTGPDGNGVTYTKPIYLVTSDITVSAAEIFVLCMKDIPHVTTIGQTTRGALSDILVKDLPNGWDFGFSNEIYLDSQGVCFEAIGIPPMIPMTILDATKADAGHADTILKIAESAK